MFFDFLFSKSHFDQFGRNATDNTVRRKRFSDNSTSSNYRATTDSHTFEDGNICTTPNAIFDNDRLVIHIHPIHKLLLNSNIRNILTQDVNAMVTGDYRRPRTEEHLLANNTWCIRTIDSTTFWNRSTIPTDKFHKPLISEDIGRIYTPLPQCFIHRYHTGAHILSHRYEGTRLIFCNR